MVSGNDRQSYELILAELSSKLHDGHVGLAERSFLFKEFGIYGAPVGLTKVDGELAVLYVQDGYKEKCDLKSGDIIVKLDGIEIDKVIENTKKYCPYTTDDRILNHVSPYILRSHNSNMNIEVLRDEKMISLDIDGVQEGYFSPHKEVLKSHEILEDNIGLINPSKLESGEIHKIMEELKETDGIVVDLRQYPSDFIPYDLAKYIVKEIKPFAYFTMPSKAVPGAFIKEKPVYSGGQTDGSYYYENKIVLLMDETTQSQPDFQ